MKNVENKSLLKIQFKIALKVNLNKENTMDRPALPDIIDSSAVLTKKAAKYWESRRQMSQHFVF